MTTGLRDSAKSTLFLVGVLQVRRDRGNAPPYAELSVASVSGARPLDCDFNPAILCPALRCIVRSNRSGVAHPFGRDDVGVDALRYEERYDGSGPPRRQHQIIGNALALQRGSDRQIVGVAVDYDFGVLEASELGNDVVGKLGLAGGTELLVLGHRCIVLLLRDTGR